MQFFVSCIRGRPMVAPTYCNPIYTVQTKIYRSVHLPVMKKCSSSLTYLPYYSTMDT